jgi:hypothetical protein
MSMSSGTTRAFGLACLLLSISLNTVAAQQNTGTGAAVAQPKSNSTAVAPFSRPPAPTGSSDQKQGTDAEYCPLVEAGMQQMLNVMGAMSGALQQAAKAAQSPAAQNKGAN